MKNDNKANTNVDWTKVLSTLNYNSRSKMGIGNYVQFNLLNPLTNEENWLKPNQEILDMVMEQFPNAKTTIKCIAWYKTNIKKQMNNQNQDFLGKMQKA